MDLCGQLADPTNSLSVGGASFAPPERSAFDSMKASAPRDRVDLVALNDQGSEERSRAMWIIGCDFHPRYQQVYGVNKKTGEVVERRLSHEGPEAKTFYRELPAG